MRPQLDFLMFRFTVSRHGYMMTGCSPKRGCGSLAMGHGDEVGSGKQISMGTLEG